MDLSHTHLQGLPIGLLFDTYYFYVTMHMEATDSTPEKQIICRVDRFSNIKQLTKKSVIHKVAINFQRTFCEIATI